MKTKTETFRCFLKIHSPVHIGCDEVYEPTSFVVEETGHSGPEMIVFDPLEFIAELNDGERKRFSEICKKGNVISILELYKFLMGKKAVGKRVALCSGFVDHYKKVVGLQSNEKVITQHLNKFEIKRTSFRSYDERPYIPGSAIKGALRTAYLNACAITKKVVSPDNKKLQSVLLDYNPGNIETDPFRLVKVSDFQPVGEVGTRIVYAINKKKKVSEREARGPYQILETLESSSVFTGEITVEQPVSKKYIIAPIKLEKLLEACNFFYSSENSRELIELEQVNIKGIDTQGQDSIPIRIGRHSGAESLTVDGYRNIKIMKGRNERPDYSNGATTFWLTSETDKATSNIGLKPFGWATLTALTPKIEKDLSSDEVVYRSEFEMNVLERLDAKVNAKSTAVEENIKSKVQNAMELAAEKIASFKKNVDSSKNISGDIQRFIGSIKNEQLPETQKELCLILRDKAESLDKKKRFSRALKEEKSWAVELNNLCKELEIEGQAGR